MFSSGDDRIRVRPDSGRYNTYGDLGLSCLHFGSFMTLIVKESLVDLAPMIRLSE